jgi:hypothetical protein
MSLRTCLVAVALAVPLLAHAATPRDAITGEWEFQADKPDPATGNEEYLRMRLKLQDDGVVCGIFLSGWQGGKNIVQGFLRGRLRGDRIDEVTYDAGWNQLVGQGRGRLVLRKDRKLEWQVTRPFTTDFMVRKAVLERGEAMLEEPPACR